MHKVALFSQVAQARHDRLLQTLSGVVGAQPTAYTHQHVLVNKDKLVHDLHRAVSLQQDASTATGPWQARIASLPEPGSPEAIFSQVNELSSINNGDYENDKVVGHHYTDGHRCVNGNVIITIYRIFATNTLLPSTSEILLLSPPCNASQLGHLDPSGAYVIEAIVRIENGTDLKFADLARKELFAFCRDYLQGVITFQVPDRFAMDTRVKGA
nr:hypothetical protein B0A51_08676 [Rachicladosporium sp. CCFEE 5018]